MNKTTVYKKDKNEQNMLMIIYIFLSITTINYSLGNKNIIFTLKCIFTK